MEQIILGVRIIDWVSIIVAFTYTAFVFWLGYLTGELKNQKDTDIINEPSDNLISKNNQYE